MFTLRPAFSSACLMALYLPPFFSLILHSFLHCSSSLCLCLCILLSISQSRIPGTVIPLCAAQCERIFTTTRIPGEETGKELNMHTRMQHHRPWRWWFFTYRLIHTWCAVKLLQRCLIGAYWWHLKEFKRGIVCVEDLNANDCLLHSPSCRLSPESTCFLFWSQVSGNVLYLTNVYFSSVLLSQFIFALLSSCLVSPQHAIYSVILFSFSVSLLCCLYWLILLDPAQWLLRSAVPCCSYQFERMFNTCRIPGTVTGSFYIFTQLAQCY